MFTKELIYLSLVLADELKQGSDKVYPICNEEELQKITDCCYRATKLSYIDNPVEQLSNLIYNLIKNHYLKDGNKRITISMMILFSILIKHDHELLLRNIQNYELTKIVKLMIEVAGSKPEEQDATIVKIEAVVATIWHK